MAADHGAKEQQDQYPTNQLKRQHWYFPATMPILLGSRGYQPPFNIT